jgi:cellulose synthase/poly-beta-1,6-N-acetylglucosamine synthase-like glycosyltransferase
MNPKVSILLPVRNEALVITDCLKCLHELSYPVDLLEIIIGNDNSTDRSDELIQVYISDKKQFKLIQIEGQGGKANALAQLANEATGNYLFFTDADMVLPKNWIQTLVKNFETNTGIVVGVTAMRGDGFFSKLQSIEWLTVLGCWHWLNKAGLQTSAMGNNMAVSREAYKATGGYEKIPFSVTEDFALYKAIIAQGFTCKNLYETDALAFTLAAPNISTWITQRKRWMLGAFGSPFSTVAVLLSMTLYWLFMPLLLYFFPKMILPFIVFKFLVRPFLIQQFIKKAFPSSYPIQYFFGFEWYLNLLNMLALFSLIFDRTIIWKDRKF